jgi:hypothetical protein
MTNTEENLAPVRDCDDLEDLDRAIAREVFGLSQEQIDAWPWGVPEFSSSRSDAAKVLCQIWLSEDKRAVMERELCARLPLQGVGLVKTLIVATPDEICAAALSAVRECGRVR